MSSQVQSSDTESVPAQASATPKPAGMAQDNWQKMASLSANMDLQSWLELQCGLIEGVYSGVLAIRESGQFQPVAVWPDANQAMDSLSDLIEQVMAEGSGLVTELLASEQQTGTEAHCFGVAFPIHVGGEVSGVIAVAVNISAESELPATMNALQWGAAWVELTQMRRLYDQRESAFTRLSTSVDLLSRVLPEPGFNSAAMRLVTELAINVNCNLVSLGLVGDKGVKLAHLSHSADFGSQMNMVRALENAMDEAVDQRAAIVLPALLSLSANLVMVAHHSLEELQQSESLLTIPLQVDDRWVGAITLQRDIDQPFTLDDVQYCESVVALAVSALEGKRDNDRPLHQKIRDAGKQQLQRIWGPGYLGRKLLLSIATILTLLGVLVNGDYRLSAPASLQTLSQQVVAAPFDGYIKDALSRAGDVVKEGDALLHLDDRDLLLEQLKWRSQQSKLSRQYQEATAAHDRARITIIDAQLEQARAQLHLVESQLQRSTLYAPFDGLVVSGDLSQRLGGVVSHGEVLFEISPVSAYRVDLLIKESRIADLNLGQTGSLYLSALPEMAFEFTVSNITPVTEYQDAATFFVVEAMLHDSHERLRPGMEGIGKVFIDERNLFSIWTRELRDWLRLRFWRWWG